MTARSLALFLHRLLAGDLAPEGPVADAATLAGLAERPPQPLRELLGAHVDALLSGWPDGLSLRPEALPATALWAAAALNNLAWAAARPDSRLLSVTLRMAQALPVAADGPAALGYHSLLRHLDRVEPAPGWAPVTLQLAVASPLTAAWLPHLDRQLGWELLLELLARPPARAALRDRWLGLAPSADEVRRTLSAERARANAEVGALLAGLLERGEAWRPFVLAFYEADCAMLRRGGEERPSWPLLEQLRAARASADPRQRRHAERALARYRPLADLLTEPALLRPYLRLDGRFLAEIAALLPPARLRLTRVG